MSTRIIVNLRTGEFFDADDAALMVSGLPLNLDAIRENGDDIQVFGDTYAFDDPARLAAALLTDEDVAKALVRISDNRTGEPLDLWAILSERARYVYRRDAARIRAALRSDTDE